MPDVRPVWITRDLRDWLERIIDATERLPGAPRQSAARSILRAWDTAPASPLTYAIGGIEVHGSGHDSITDAKAVLAALGYSEADA